MDRDEHIFAYVMDELDSGIKNEALWIKAYAMVDGLDEKVKPRYIQYRVEEIKSLFKKNNIYYNTLSKEDIYECLDNDLGFELTPEWMKNLWKWADENKVSDLECVTCEDEDVDEDLWIYGISRDKKKLLLQDRIDLREENIIVIPEEIRFLTHLKELKLSNLKITKLPDCICRLTHLEKLDLSNTNITKFSKELGNLQNLKELWIVSNDNLNELPKEIGNLQNLKKLSIKGNDNLNELPKEIGNLQNLKELSIQSNDNLNELPVEIGNLVNLEELELYGEIKTLPKEIGNLSSLKVLNFSYYQGSGMICSTSFKPIPDEISNLLNLEEMYISDLNKYDIPASMFDIKKLKISCPVDYPYKPIIVKESE